MSSTLFRVVRNNIPLYHTDHLHNAREYARDNAGVVQVRAACAECLDTQIVQTGHTDCVLNDLAFEMWMNTGSYPVLDDSEFWIELSNAMSRVNVMTMVESVRADRLVGKGSCSSIAECWNDNELAELIELCESPAAAVLRARTVEGVHLERGLNQRFGDDDDDQLIAYHEFQEELKEYPIDRGIEELHAESQRLHLDPTDQIVHDTLIKDGFTPPSGPASPLMLTWCIGTADCDCPDCQPDTTSHDVLIAALSDRGLDMSEHSIGRMLVDLIAPIHRDVLIAAACDQSRQLLDIQKIIVMGVPEFAETIDISKDVQKVFRRKKHLPVYTNALGEDRLMAEHRRLIEDGKRIQREQNEEMARAHQYLCHFNDNPPHLDGCDIAPHPGRLATYEKLECVPIVGSPVVWYWITADDVAGVKVSSTIAEVLESGNLLVDDGRVVSPDDIISPSESYYVDGVPDDPEQRTRRY
jgi:hypothetical protein